MKYFDPLSSYLEPWRLYTLFLGLLFLLATVLIIYYKQASEGYDDRERFVIMQKVGMTEKEVKGTIHSQVLIVFFLPLVTAAIHICFAFPMIHRILMAFGMMVPGMISGQMQMAMGYTKFFAVAFLFAAASVLTLLFIPTDGIDDKA